MTTLFTLVFVLVGWRAGLARLSDNSFLWHLRTGRWMLEHGIPREDIYSFTAAGHSWVAQSWLAELLYGLLDAAFGPFGVRLLVAVTSAAIAGVAYRLTVRAARDRVRAVGLCVAGVGASLTLWSERPLLFGLVCLVGLLWVVEVPDSAVGRRPLIWVPVLLWVWVNLHGTFALGFAYLALHLAGRWLDGAPPWQGRERDLAKAGALALVVCLANPYGPTLVLFPVELLARGDILRRVSEWHSPDFRSVAGAGMALWLAVFVACLALGPHRPSRRDLVVTVPFVLLALWAQRNIAVAPLVGLPVAARALASTAARPDTASPLNRMVAALVVVIGLAWTAQAAQEPDFALRSYPVRAMDAVEDQGLLGRRLLSTDRWGGYLIARWWPRQRVFVDDRYDMYPTRFVADYIRVFDVDPGWDAVLRRYDIEVVVWNRKHPLVEVLERDPAWQRLHRDDVAVVYVRRPGPDDVKAGSDTGEGVS